MGLPWVRLDTNFYSNPKFLYLVQDKKWRAISVYMAGLAYAGAQGTDGFLPAACLPLIHGTKNEARALAEVGLWVESLGGWEINSWNEHQQSNEDTQLRKKRAREAAMARWHPD